MQLFRRPSLIGKPTTYCKLLIKFRTDGFWILSLLREREFGKKKKLKKKYTTTKHFREKEMDINKK